MVLEWTRDPGFGGEGFGPVGGIGRLTCEASRAAPAVAAVVLVAEGVVGFGAAPGVGLVGAVDNEEEEDVFGIEAVLARVDA